MAPVNSYAKESFSVNFIRYDNEMLYRQMKRMFRVDFNEPLTVTEVALLVKFAEHKANGEQCKTRGWSLLARIAMETQTNDPPDQPCLFDEKIGLFKETLAAGSVALLQVQRHYAQLPIQRARKKNSSERVSGWISA